MNIQLGDARTSAFYTGKKGRIPTAKLTPMIRYVKKVNNHYEFLSKEEESKTLNNNDFRLDLEKESIYYCNTGHKARGLWFVSIYYWYGRCKSI